MPAACAAAGDRKARRMKTKPGVGALY